MFDPDASDVEFCMKMNIENYTKTRNLEKIKEMGPLSIDLVRQTLLLSCRNGADAIFEWVLPKVFSEDFYTWQDAVREATFNSRTDFVRRILECCPKSVVSSVSDCFYYACLSGDVDLTRVFLVNNIDIFSDAGSCINIAVEKGNLDVCKLLKHFGAEFVQSHLAIAGRNEQWEIVEWLEGSTGLKLQKTYEKYERYRALRQKVKTRAKNKIFFWIMPRLYRNPEFVKKQAEKSWDDVKTMFE